MSARAADWRGTWRTLAQPSALTMLFLGFGSGLPFLLVSGTLAFWLKESGYRLDQITLLAGAGLSYALKFLWAPLVDRWRLPLFGRVGLRRGWLLAAQLAVALGLLGMAAVAPGALAPFVALTLFTAFAGATQDIVVDAYRVEIAPPEAQGALAATYTLGYRLALILSYAAALIMADHMAWPTVYAIMAASMLVPAAATLLAAEPAQARPATSGWRASMREGVVAPFADFFRRYRGRIGIGLLAFVLLFKISDQALSGGLVGPFYLAAGFSKTEIGLVTKLYGVWIGIAGAFVGGVAVARWGIVRCLWLAMILGAASNLLYVLLAQTHGSTEIFVLAISGENLAGGFLGTVAVAYLSALVNQRYTATQYALFSSLVNLPGKLLGLASGSLVLWLSAAPQATMPGYERYFVFTTVAILPALLLFLWLARRVPVDRPGR
ncbi:MAG: MFS transporter [Mizugakiibacter sp.]|uniref:AmpG family muropeptide MFS transporter n=1 Tax=Mizugakiibacter sp. TaxID=1972610 RepID=UPI0031C3B60F|nr:MFS transporter [Xanthomonadaceae bacterium]